MRITILTIGSRGDVQPYVALGQGLQAAGYQVRLAAHDNFETFVRDRGLTFFSIAADPRGILEGEAGRNWLEAGNPVTFMRQMINAARPAMWQILADFWQACQDTDLVLYPVLAALPVASIAEKLSLPAYPAYLQHVHPTRVYPSSLVMPRPRLGGIYNRMTYTLTGQLFWQFLRPIVNQWRVDTLGLLPFPFKNPFDAWRKQRQPFLYGFSPHVIPKPPEWGHEVHITGYWFLPAQTTWEPPEALLDFLRSGPPPVCVGFGSMTNRNPEEVTDIVLKALSQSRQRGLLVTGWGGLSNADLPDDVFKIESAPFDWLFPQMTAVIHHGGAGTTATGLRAGVPAIVVPFFGDQHFWGWRVAQLGAGPRPIPRKKLSAERLAAAIEETVSNERFRNRAAAVGRQIRAEDGVTAAVNVLNHHLA